MLDLYNHPYKVSLLIEDTYDYVRTLVQMYKSAIHGTNADELIDDI